ncbi:2TM domain-containing protein [Mangrovimonas cancribranchiae]|uniref:2TM domain-containing protein n=1 Tax=Mangrovimonas cancribranchiae TaxID=3080055 RepID=A0AAU6NYV1_9FLAO
MESNFNEQQRIDNARRRVKKLKGFYSHLVVYIVINALLLIINVIYVNPGESFFQWSNFSTMFFWGIGLLAHGLTVFMPKFIMGKDWEERKIKQFMEQEKHHNRWE